ncbi:isoleucine--tRNA ligase [Candidatus Xianfuyuplasma coldseepsis]|uniref:Isoleucine--tRNA ligase n=1 Tax=Candidatus Xianfuyuplasma coldseepsis TaxID=2782163 RepID=A0A7L7KT05_9MOLU|nr:isoleucine--tRNA ligase [Xianfuyuplasma coldseepsis]QMS85837.1 isoleucine--tRNA ligase [Xianfuyuplasma coldseepsis]
MGNDYKHTLHMPKTDFPMRGNLGNNEPKMQTVWDEMNLYQQRLDKNKGHTEYVLHDGPPYANGNIHIGHAMNKILKDMVLRYKSMRGFYTRYVPGWDTHGLPIETALVKTKKVNRNLIDKVDFRKMCYDYAMEQVATQKEQFKRLGILGEWDNPYITLYPKYEASQLRVFADMVEKGLIFKGLKPIFWSPSSETALAEAEIEYHDKQSPSIYVAMDAVDTLGKVDYDFKFLIWTTTPWTIPANLAIAVGDHILYSFVKVDGDQIYLCGTDLISELTAKFGWERVEVLEDIKGYELEHMTYKHPLYDRVSPIVLGHHVSTEGGTGLVHTAPGHGEDDFVIGQNYNLDILCPVDEKGFMTKEAGPYEGEFIEDCNKSVVRDLDACGALLKMEWYTHSYPHDWRTKKPVIFRATAQWFASIESLKDDMLKEIKNVNWYPSWGEVRMENMVKDRKAWCISRQRTWGVPIPVFYNEDGSEILDKDVINHVANIVEQEGTNAWYTKSAQELLPEGYTNEASPNNEFQKETDILDVWFDSGTSHQGGMTDFGLPYPSDLYLEGSDQYRGWFNSSLSTGVAHLGQSPYKTCVTHGFVLDGDGRKMSKSLGNVVDPLKIIKQMGADILRLWVASVDYQSDVRISNDMMKQVSESYRKIRNTIRFMLGNLSDFNPTKDRVAFDQLVDVDQYVYLQLNELVKSALEHYDNFEFDTVYRDITNFVTRELSAFYLDFTKDILYITKADDPARRSVQTVLYDTTRTLLQLLTPFLPHTTHEAYLHLPHHQYDNVYLEDMPKPLDVDGSEILDTYNAFMQIRDNVNKALEEARNKQVIGKSFNAKLTLYPNEDVKALLKKMNANLGQLFIVSQFEMKDGTGEYAFSNMSVDVEKAEGETCDRCWQVVDHTHDGLCHRCQDVLDE